MNLLCLVFALTAAPTTSQFVEIRDLVIVTLVTAVVGLLRQWLQSRKLGITVIAGVDLIRARLLSALETHPAVAQILRDSQVDIPALAADLDKVAKDGIEAVSKDAGLQTKLDEVVHSDAVTVAAKTTATRLAEEEPK